MSNYLVLILYQDSTWISCFSASLKIPLISMELYRSCPLSLYRLLCCYLKKHVFLLSAISILNCSYLNLIIHTQRAADESTSRAAELEHKLALLEVTQTFSKMFATEEKSNFLHFICYYRLNMHLWTKSYKIWKLEIDVDRRNLLKILTKFFK